MGDPALKFLLAPWSDAAAQRLATIKGATGAMLRDWAADVGTGRARLLGVHFDGSQVGFVVWSIQGNAVTIEAATIDPIKGQDMTERLLQFGRDMCDRHGCKVLRFETYRTGLQRKLAGRMTTKYVMELSQW
jgi:hypothetical protein